MYMLTFLRKNLIPSAAILAIPSLLAPVALAAIEDNLVGYYPLDSDFTNSITTNALANGSAVNSPTAGVTGGKAGNAMSLQGADNDHMNLVASFGTGSTLGENFTISTWYKLNEPITSSSSSNRYFVFESSTNYDVSYGLRDSGLGVAGINDGQAYTQSASHTIADAGTNGWRHVIQTYASADGTTTITTYIDGVNSGELSLVTSSLSGNGFNFGAARSATTDRGFDGLIDEIAIWNRALPSDELATVYALGLNSQPLISNDPPSTAPTINTFTASPSSVLVGGSTNLTWAVTGADSVTIVNGPNNVAATGTESVTLNQEQTYTLVAINGNSTQTSQLTVTVDGPTDPVGPYIGTIKNTEAYFLYSPGQEELTLRLTVMTDAGATVTSVDSSSLAANDYVAKFHATGLTEGTHYRYKIEKVAANGDSTLYAGDTAEHHFTTVPTQRIGKVATAGFVACVNDTSAEVWAEMLNHNLDLLCLAGDTPYVDTGNLTTIRQKHRDFLQTPNLAALAKNISVVGTWDDHDFGLNGGNGVSTASRKVNTRQGFVEYRAHDRYGDETAPDNAGIYHKTDMGAMEIFLLDPRWFSQTEASPIDATQSTCFGSAQWQWLLDSIRNSKAPFKILVQGQIWQDKKNGETDDMFTYWSERDKLLDIIRDEKIPGVVLFGGDIHVSRYLMHPQRVGYDLHDFVMSPGHKSVISSLNVYHPSLEWSRETKNQFLTMKADTTKDIPELTVRFLDDGGNVNHEVVIGYDELSPKRSDDLADQLRALWTFDQGLDNSSVLGNRLDATAHNGASTGASNGIRGGALDLSSANSQYLSVPRSFLDDNASAYSVSSWVKSNGLPAHGSSDRHFLMESFVNNHTGDLPSSNRVLPNASTTGYAISIGISATTDTNKVNLQLHTETLEPKAVGSQQSPGVAAQGGFDFDVDRSIFDNWTNVIVTFDSEKLKLYVNGQLAIEHTLTTTAPIAETGGLIIGGHRSGTGRNFDGLIDEVAIWNKTLTAAQAIEIYANGTPPAIPTKTTHVDNDNDALSDWWEDVNGLDKNNQADANTDTDGDNISAFEEFGFGLSPNHFDQKPPFTAAIEEVNTESYLSISYDRNTPASDLIDFIYESSITLQSDSWNTLTTMVENVTDLGNGLERVTALSPQAISNQQREFLRVRLSKKN